MNAYVAAFEKYIKEHPLDYGDDNVNSLLEMFYWCYWENNPMETEKIKALFREMDETLPDGIHDDLFNLICRLCIEQGRAAFLEGLRAGAQWMLELAKT